MTSTRTVPLAGPITAAAADRATVWCAVAGRLLTFDAAGSLTDDVPAPGRIRSLAAAGGQLAAVTEPGVVSWLDDNGATANASLPVGEQAVLVAGGPALWVIEVATQRARRLAGVGSLSEPVPLPGADRLAADGQRIWWTTREDTVLRGGSQPVDLQVPPAERGGLVACSGSIWCSVAGGLLRVGGWAAELGRPLEAPEGPVDHLCCADGILVGGSGRHGLFCLDPNIDADVRHLEVDVGGPLRHLVATHAVVWAFAQGRAAATLVAVRSGLQL